MLPTPITTISLDGRTFYIKRDDLFDFYLAGNKFRKLYTLLQTPKKDLTKVISYGGTQSNAMVAIAALCKEKGWTFEYYTKPVSSFLKEQKKGNYIDALNFGMQHIELEENLYRDFVASLSVTLDEKTFVIHQGGANKEALFGLEVLAQELLQANVKFDAIATPSGTGTTALFLAKNIPHVKVYTTPCIGDVEYLKTQMLALEPTLPKNLVILEPKQKYHFAKPYNHFFAIYEKLLDAGVEFDLLYAPAMWEALLEQTKETVLYIHSGGVSGNATMQERYVRKFSVMPPK